tara:strand:+ start:373 stop:543 length:171 start_codon:yes stop_codon:yes gene_type:complete
MRRLPDDAGANWLKARKADTGNPLGNGMKRQITFDAGKIKTLQHYKNEQALKGPAK